MFSKNLQEFFFCQKNTNAGVVLCNMYLGKGYYSKNGLLIFFFAVVIFCFFQI